MSIKIIFAGTPEIACPALAALIADPNCDVVAVYTQPDRPSGRGRKLTASPVKALAQQHNLTIEQPENFKSDHALATLKNFAADVMVVMAYGLILPAAVIDAAKNDCINLPNRNFHSCTSSCCLWKKFKEYSIDFDNDFYAFASFYVLAINFAVDYNFYFLPIF